MTESERARLIADVREHDRMMGGRVCRWCGCTDNAGCNPPCSWVAEGLCSTCGASTCLWCYRACERCRCPVEPGFEHVEQAQPEGSTWVVCSSVRVQPRPLIEALSLYMEHTSHSRKSRRS
jgi:hypothetical protein